MSQLFTRESCLGEVASGSVAGSVFSATTSVVVVGTTRVAGCWTTGACPVCSAGRRVVTASLPLSLPELVSVLASVVVSSAAVDLDASVDCRLSSLRRRFSAARLAFSSRLLARLPAFSSSTQGQHVWLLAS